MRLRSITGAQLGDIRAEYIKTITERLYCKQPGESADHVMLLLLLLLLCKSLKECVAQIHIQLHIVM